MVVVSNSNVTSGLQHCLAAKSVFMHKSKRARDTIELSIVCLEETLVKLWISDVISRQGRPHADGFENSKKKW
jgi:hypothetical protein